MKYEELQPISHVELREALLGPKPSDAARAILRMTLHEPDLRWAERKCLDALHDGRLEVRAAAITGLGHLARIHHALIDPAIVEELKKLRKDPMLGGIAEDTLEDITTFASSQTRAN